MFMSESFFRAMKWIFAVLCVVLGLYGFYAAEQAQNIRPIAFCVIGFGVAYMMSKVWKNTPGKVSLIGTVFIMALAVFSRLDIAAMLYFMAFNAEIPENFFMVWTALIVVLGIPFMTVLFKVLD